MGHDVTVAVSDELMAESYMKALAIQSAMGGIVSVIVGRRRTDLEGEAITTGAVFEWKDGVSTRVKPEPETAVVPEIDEEPYETAGDMGLADLHEPSPGVTPHVDPAEAATGSRHEPMREPEPTHTIQRRLEPDGLDPATLDVEDDSAIPEPAR